jgi:hypothetical protein
MPSTTQILESLIDISFWSKALSVCVCVILRREETLQLADKQAIDVYQRYKNERQIQET